MQSNEPIERIAIIGDTHFNRKAENPLIRRNIANGQKAFFEKTIGELKEKGVHTVIFTGDIFDNRQILDIQSINDTIRLFRDDMRDFDVRIVLGNHDLYYENSYDTSSLSILENLPNVKVYRNGIEEDEIIGYRFVFFPWIIPDAMPEAVKKLEEMANEPDDVKRKTVIVGHFDILGMVMEGKNVSVDGMDRNLFFKAARLTISGHYHGQSHVKSTNSTILYVGSPYQMTFNNVGEKHGYWVMESSGKFSFTENTVSPKFVDVWDTNDLDNLPDLGNCFVRLYSSNENTAEQDFNNKVRIEVKKPILIRHVPYDKDRDEVEEVDQPEGVESAGKILKMNILSLSELYIDNNEDSLPSLTSGDDARKVVLKQIDEYEKSIL